MPNENHVQQNENEKGITLIHSQKGCHEFTRDGDHTEFNLKPVLDAITAAIASFATERADLPISLAVMKSTLEQSNDTLTFTFSTDLEDEKDQHVAVIIQDNMMTKYIITKVHSASKKAGEFFGLFGSSSYQSVMVNWEMETIVANNDQGQKLLNQKQMELVMNRLDLED